jgi:rhomboid family GlyGly-CTERM serine protease
VSVAPPGKRGWQSLRRQYFVPACAGLLAAAAELGGETARMALRYDRIELAAGELWRLITGHLVHLGPSHMAMNVVATGVLALIFSRLIGWRDWLLYLLGAALAIDAGLYLFHPSIGWYVGLSGVLHGIWAGGSVRAWRANDGAAVGLTVLIVIKLAYEAWVGPIAATGAMTGGAVVTEAHLFGAAGGAAVALVQLAVARNRRPL